MPAKRTLGIDYGLARIGLALSDERAIIASPAGVLLAKKELKQTAEALIHEITRLETEKECEISTLVMGMPYHMDGREGSMAEDIHQLIGYLKEWFTGEIITWDERLTSVQADRMLREGKLSRKKRAQVVDTVAAAIILQNYLDSISPSH